MRKRKLKKILKKHQQWLKGTGGKQANFTWANLRWAYLGGVDLREANLSGADLHGANLREANLNGANLSGASLCEIDFTGTNLTGTYLDPTNVLPKLTDSELLEADFKLEGGYVIGWRTKHSLFVGNTEYKPGYYKAPWFSTDTNTECHPGLYLAGLNWLKEKCPNSEYVKVRCKRCDLLHAGNKWRCKAFKVLTLEE